MSDAILASFFHICSSKERSLHDRCEKGPNSWCQYQKDISNGTKLHVDGPGLSDDVIKVVKPIFEDLVNPKELAKCLHGKTQN